MGAGGDRGRGGRGLELPNEPKNVASLLGHLFIMYCIIEVTLEREKLCYNIFTTQSLFGLQYFKIGIGICWDWN